MFLNSFSFFFFLGATLYLEVQTKDDVKVLNYDNNDGQRWATYVKKYVDLFPNIENHSTLDYSYDTMVTVEPGNERGWRIAGVGEYPYSSVTFSPYNDMRCGGILLSVTFNTVPCVCVRSIIRAVDNGASMYEPLAHFDPKADRTFDLPDSRLYVYVKSTIHFSKKDGFRVEAIDGDRCRPIFDQEDEDNPDTLSGQYTTFTILTIDTGSEVSFGDISAPWPPRPLLYPLRENNESIHTDHSERTPVQMITAAIASFNLTRVIGGEDVGYSRVHFNMTDTLVFYPMVIRPQRDCLLLLRKGQLFTRYNTCMCGLQKTVQLKDGLIGSPAVLRGRIFGHLSGKVTVIPGWNLSCALIEAYDRNKTKYVERKVPGLVHKVTKLYRNRTSHEYYDVFVPDFGSPINTQGLSSSPKLLNPRINFFVKYFFALKLIGFLLVSCEDGRALNF